jgi:hypothetical protein
MSDDAERPEDAYYEEILLRRALYRFFRRMGKPSAFLYDAGPKSRLIDVKLNQRVNMIYDRGPEPSEKPKNWPPKLPEPPIG